MIYVAASIVSDCLLLKLHSRIFDVVPVAALDGLLFGKSHLITYVNATPVDIFLLDMSHAVKANYIIAMLVSIFLLGKQHHTIADSATTTPLINFV